MCTVVLSWHPVTGHPAGEHPAHHDPVRILALRDELVGREFDPPGAWWPGQPVIGGRDRVAGGSWCVSDTDAGVTALVVNRTEQMAAGAGAASRGVLPLLASRWGTAWVEHVELAPMAGFNLLLAGPDEARLWSWDGTSLVGQRLTEGEHLITPGGLDDAEEPRVARFGASLKAAEPDTAALWKRWRQVLGQQQPEADRSALIVRRQVPGGSYQTVFGQLIAAGPGRLRLDYTATPAEPGSWTRHVSGTFPL